MGAACFNVFIMESHRNTQSAPLMHPAPPRKPPLELTPHHPTPHTPQKCQPPRPPSRSRRAPRCTQNSGKMPRERTAPGAKISQKGVKKRAGDAEHRRAAVLQLGRLHLLAVEGQPLEPHLRRATPRHACRRTLFAARGRPPFLLWRPFCGAPLVVTAGGRAGPPPAGPHPSPSASWPAPACRARRTGPAGRSRSRPARSSSGQRHAHRCSSSCLSTVDTCHAAGDGEDELESERLLLRAHAEAPPEGAASRSIGCRGHQRAGCRCNRARLRKSPLTSMAIMPRVARPKKGAASARWPLSSEIARPCVASSPYGRPVTRDAAPCHSSASGQPAAASMASR
eukprot:720650-Prymnesium_polylepis.2